MARKEGLPICPATEKPCPWVNWLCSTRDILLKMGDAALEGLEIIEKPDNLQCQIRRKTTVKTKQ